jgi:O-methyltransferase
MQGQMDISPRARWHNCEFTKATGGFYPPNSGETRRIHDLTAHDNTRRDMLVLLLRTVLVENIPGRFAELGVYRGHTAKLIHHYAPERKLHLFDTFSGFTERSVVRENQSTGIRVEAKEFADTSLAGVESYIQQRNDNVEYHPGFFPESIPPDLLNERFAFVHLDADLYEPTLEGLKFFYPRTARGGMLVVHDYNSWFGARKAVDDFLKDKPEFPVPMPDKSGSALILKQ